MAEDTEGPDYGEGSIARDLGEQYRELHRSEKVTVTAPDNRSAQLLILPAGRKAVSIKKIIDEYREKPERRRGVARLFDVDSFIAHFKRFASLDSAVFANPDRNKPAFIGVLDYHPASSEATTADWLNHRAVFEPTLSDEWKAWMAKNGQFMSQADFASFIEDRITNVIVPNLDDDKIRTFASLVQGTFAEPTDLVRLSRGLEVNVGGTVKSAVRTSTGEITVVFNEQHNGADGQPIRVPNLFQIAIPVFFGGELFRIAVWLRYRVGGGGITWAYQLVQPDVVFREAFTDLVKKIEDEISGEVFLGQPETSAS